MNEYRTAKSLVVGAGGIGLALADQLRMRGEVTIWSRSSGIDVTIESDIAAAAQLLAGDLATVFVTTGMLHDATQRPERAMRELDAGQLARSFLVNTIAPVLVAKHVLPRLPRDRRAVFAVLGARVGSIGDNRTGGWHGYRASKAALVMLVKTLSIELKRTHPHAVCVALHPGTVDTAMSKPFQGNVAPDKLFTAEFAAERLLAVADALTPADSGGHFAWDGTRIAH
ncbi:SDR family NAD(P)-dependent oxidoreductase [Sphingomonas sp. SUN039]|uniref:SDR family NAD(P)-dependent oxidoreductase n=1 Tax=Sphingomonas sp. SUN039 TaxID=2937787 RepID=UPI002164E62E|nr:SDR family NAD(P)-dependent oxidoreductase [Sphingomonas sp. SUN039]UVO53235.1 SDR family NAD(P)-dependent oxidoreductase [Sphingomonas sp. SUN039]